MIKFNKLAVDVEKIKKYNALYEKICKEENGNDEAIVRRIKELSKSLKREG